MKTDSKLKDLDDEVWILRLFVAGKTSKSLKAFSKHKEICITTRNQLETLKIYLNFRFWYQSISKKVKRNFRTNVRKS